MMDSLLNSLFCKRVPQEVRTYSLVSFLLSADGVVVSVQILSITLFIMLDCGYSSDCNQNTPGAWTKGNKCVCYGWLLDISLYNNVPEFYS
jgi:hypothetical protein